MRLVETSGGRTELVELLGDHIAARDPEFLAHADALIADSLCAASPLITEDERAARVSTKKEEVERRWVEREALHDLPCETRSGCSESRQRLAACCGSGGGRGRLDWDLSGRLAPSIKRWGGASPVVPGLHSIRRNPTDVVNEKLMRDKEERPKPTNRD